MGKSSKELLAIFIAAILSFLIFKNWYNTILVQSPHMQDIELFDKIGKYLLNKEKFINISIDILQ